MAETNGAIAPNDGGTSDGELPDGAIDTAIEAVETAVVDTRAIKAEQEAVELKQRLRAQEDRIADLQKTTVSQSEMLSELVGRSREAEDRGWDWARNDALKRMEDAVNQADNQAFRAARQDLDALEHHQQARKQKKPKDDPAAGNKQPAQADHATQAAYQAWVAENPWFNTDNQLRVQAAAIDALLLADEPHLSAADRYKKVREPVVRVNPDKFTNQARQQPPTVSRPGPQAATKPKPKEPTLADLDDDAKAALAAIKRVDPKFKEQDYIKGYKQREARQKEISRL
jgi:hypothetical protein